jgi:cytoskeletal protein RodZ
MEPNNLNNNELFDEEVSIDQPSNNGSSNKPFIIGIGILGAVVVLSILAIIAYVILFRPQTTTDLQEQAAEIYAQNTAIAFVATQTAEVEVKQATEKAAPPTTKVAPTATPVVEIATETSAPTTQATSVAGQDPAIRTATVAAFQTQAAAAQAGTQAPEGTVDPQVTPTTLPTAGFMDDVGLPALLGAAIGLVIVILLVRRLRFST